MFSVLGRKWLLICTTEQVVWSCWGTMAKTDFIESLGFGLSHTATESASRKHILAHKAVTNRTKITALMRRELVIALSTGVHIHHLVMSASSLSFSLLIIKHTPLRLFSRFLINELLYTMPIMFLFVHQHGITRGYIGYGSYSIESSWNKTIVDIYPLSYLIRVID